MNVNNHENDFTQGESSPSENSTVLVECEGIRHLANQDSSGRWRTISRRRELPEPVQVIRIVV
jgi:hypothetical protein